MSMTHFKKKFYGNMYIYSRKHLLGRLNWTVVVRNFPPSFFHCEEMFAFLKETLKAFGSSFIQT